jgi:hypothetical protein
MTRHAVRYIWRDTTCDNSALKNDFMLEHKILLSSYFSVLFFGEFIRYPIEIIGLLSYQAGPQG